MRVWTVNQHLSRGPEGELSALERDGRVCRCERVDLSPMGVGPRAVAHGVALAPGSGWTVPDQAKRIGEALAPLPLSKRGLDLNWLLIPDVHGDKVFAENADAIVEIFRLGRVPWWSVPSKRRDFFGALGFAASAACQLEPLAAVVKSIGGVDVVWAETSENPLCAESLTLPTLRRVLALGVGIVPDAVFANAALLSAADGWQRDAARFTRAKAAFDAWAAEIVHRSVVELLRVVGVANEATRVVMPYHGVSAARWSTDDGLGRLANRTAQVDGAVPCDYLLVGKRGEADAGSPKRPEALARAVDKARALGVVEGAVHKLNISDVSVDEAGALGRHLGAVLTDVVAWSDVPAEDAPESAWRPRAEIDAVLSALARGAQQTEGLRPRAIDIGTHGRPVWSLMSEDVLTPVPPGATVVTTAGIATDMRRVAEVGRTVVGA